MSNNVGRPANLADNDILQVTSGMAQTKLQAQSERRAIVNKVIDEGGSITLKKLNDHFGYNVRSAALALVNLGWLTIKQKKVKS